MTCPLLSKQRAPHGVISLRLLFIIYLRDLPLPPPAVSLFSRMPTTIHVQPLVTDQVSPTFATKNPKILAVTIYPTLTIHTHQGQNEREEQSHEDSL